MLNLHKRIKDAGIQNMQTSVSKKMPWYRRETQRLSKFYVALEGKTRISAGNCRETDFSVIVGGYGQKIYLDKCKGLSQEAVNSVTGQAGPGWPLTENVTKGIISVMCGLNQATFERYPRCWAPNSLNLFLTFKYHFTTKRSLWGSFWTLCIPCECVCAESLVTSNSLGPSDL